MLGIFHDHKEMDILADEILSIERPLGYDDDSSLQETSKNKKTQKEFIFQV